MFDGPVRGGTRGGQAEFKWADVSADKDRENYLGHSINAPTGRWQKNKDVHWYNRDLKRTEAERLEEIRKIKEAEEDALAVALGFKPAPKPGEVSNVPVTASLTSSAPKNDNSTGESISSNAIADGEGAGDGTTPLLKTAEDAEALVIKKEEKRRLKEEKRQRKEEKQLKKEMKRAKKAEREAGMRRSRQRDMDEEEEGRYSYHPHYRLTRYRSRSRTPRSLSPKRVRGPPLYTASRSRSRSRSPPPRRIEQYYPRPSRRSPSRSSRAPRSPSPDERVERKREGGPYLEEERRYVDARERQRDRRGRGRSIERSRSRSWPREHGRDKEYRGAKDRRGERWRG